MINRTGWLVSCLLVVWLYPAGGLAADAGGPDLPDCRYPERTPAGSVSASGQTGWQRFPSDDLFRPLLADPKQPQFVISRQRINPDSGDDFVAGLVVYGETFGMYRYLTGRPCEGIQMDIQGGVFAQFNVSSPSSDLLNADYVVRGKMGVRVLFRARWSFAFRKCTLTPILLPSRCSIDWEVSMFMADRRNARLGAQNWPFHAGRALRSI